MGYAGVLPGIAVPAECAEDATGAVDADSPAWALSLLLSHPAVPW